VIARGLVAGAALGLAEVALTYATGLFPRTDAPRVFLFDVALGTALGIVAAAMLRLAPGSGALRSAALWTLRSFAPVLILVRGILVRGAPASATTLVAAPGAVAAGALIAALVSAYALRSAHGRETRARSVASAAGCAALAGACAVLLGTTPCRTPPQGAVAAANPARPSVLLIVLDTVRRDHVSAYGYERRTTPSIDAFAQRAHLFVNAYATSPYTLSSHASLFTGLLPSEHGAHPVSHRSTSGSPLQRITGAYYPLGPEAPTLADRLRTRGYRTAAISGNHAFFGAWSGLARGFECLTTVQRRYRYYPLAHAAAQRAARALFHAHLSPFLRADHVTEGAVGWIRSIGEQPFLLFLNYFDAHEPYAPPPPYDRLFLTGRPRAGVQDRWHKNRHYGRLDKDDVEYLVSQYDGEIAYLDSQLGRLLDWLERASLLDRTLVLVTSDHGEYFGEHGLYGHGKALYEEALRVPLLVKLPGQRSGTRIERRLGLHEVASIVEGVVGGATDPLAPAHAGTGPRVLAEYWLPDLLVRARPDLFKAGYVRAAYDGGYKLIQADVGGDELYDLSEDQGEARNLLALEPERAAPLRARIVAAAPPLVDVTSTKRVAPSLNPEMLDQLRALGYVR
jgi:arylsulfatase A-like enzyme